MQGAIGRDRGGWSLCGRRLASARKKKIGDHKKQKFKKTKKNKKSEREIERAKEKMSYISDIERGSF